MTKTKDLAVAIRQMLTKDADLSHRVEEESFSADIATEIYNARQEKGLSQKELARLVNTQQTVISRLENADYDGHSLTMLRRIAEALDQRVRVEFYAPQNFAVAHAIGIVESHSTRWAQVGSWQPDVSVTSGKKNIAEAS